MILYRVIFSCSVLKLEMPRSQTQLLFHEILHLKEALVISLAFIILVLNKWEPVKITLKDP